MLKRVVNLPFKVLGKAARAVQEREDAARKARHEESPEEETTHIPKIDVPDDFEVKDLERSVEDVQALMQGKNFAIVDVRDGTRSAQIPGAQHFPLQVLDIQLAELPPAGNTIIVYCLDGEQSTRAVRFLRFRGIDESFVLAGGFHAWTESGAPQEPSS